MNFSLNFNVSEKVLQPAAIPFIETSTPSTSEKSDKVSEIISNTPQDTSTEKKYISAKRDNRLSE